MRLIDKRELMELLDNMFSRYDGTPSVMEGFKYGLDAVISEVSVMPTVDAEPTRHGKWIKVGDNSYKCSRCNEISCCEGNFCVDCGAKMDE